MRRDLKNNVLVSPGAAEALSGTTDITGAEIDMQGFDSAMFALCVGTLAATSLDAELRIHESDVSGSGFALVADANDLVGVAPSIDQDADDSCVTLGYVGNKRYIKPVLVVTANDGTDVVSMTAMQNKAHAAPVEGN